MKTIISVAAVLAAFSLTPALAAGDAAKAGAAKAGAASGAQTQAAGQGGAIGQPGKMEVSVEQFAQDAIAAQQIANLATDKHTATAVELLGDRISLTQGRINQDLDKLAAEAELEMPQRMSEEHVQSMEAMTDLNEDEFASKFVGWVGHTYPRMIGTLEAWSAQGDGQRKQIAETYLPELQMQLHAANQLMEGGWNSQQAMETLQREGPPIERKDGPEVGPAGPGTGR